MSSPAGWYAQTDGQQRYWDGDQWTEHFAPGIPAETTSVPPFQTEPATGSDGRSFSKAASFGWGGLALTFLIGALSGGFSGAVIMLGLFALVVGVIAVARGQVSWARLGSRAAGGIAIGAAMALLTVGAIAAPSTSPTGGSATASSETPTVADAAAEKAAAELTAANQAATDQAAAEVAAADKVAADQAAADQAAAEKAAADKAAADQAAAEKATADKAIADKAAADKAAEAEAEAAKPKFTVAQENAIRTAQDYIDYSGFSRSGLIDQVIFDGFSAKDATVAVDYMKVNWNDQAARTAKDYIDYSGFSRSGLIDQLIFDGYTRAQATYGANSVGLK